MKVNFVFGDLNPCGGGERLTLVTMQAIMKMGIDFFDLTTFERPDISKLESAFGKSIASIMKNIRQTSIINILEELEKQQSIVNYDARNYDITINTHGDKVPFYHSYFSKDNAITYCHFPTAKKYLGTENMDYLKKDLKTGVTSSISYNSKKAGGASIKLKRNEDCFRILREAYFDLIRNSTVITNSEFSRNAIFDAFEIDDIHVLSPPVDVSTFRNGALRSKDRKNLILMVCRIDPLKKIENAIKLARILKDSNIGKGMKIVGSISHYNLDYYSGLNKIVEDFDLSDYVTFETNASLDRLLSIMREAKVYFHPMVGEHFGMSVAEAMAAGLVPVVPSVGGPTEFVFKKYQFNTLEEAVPIISSAFHLPFEERVQISNSVNKFSTSNYVAGFQKIVKGMISNR
jgi:glycosyltransferase involved in cell wall biosynthesis